jgi:hypothetical protein
MPSAPNAGQSSDFFELHDGKVTSLGEGVAVAALAAPRGAAPSFRLPSGDTFAVRQASSPYYDTLAHMRINWNEGRLDQLETTQFDVQPHRGDHPEDTAIDFYPAPDANAKPHRLHISPESKIAIVKAVRTPASQDGAGKQGTTEWLKIVIDGQQGYVTGEADFGAIGLLPLGGN